MIEFCDALSVRAEYILLGDGTPSKGQSRTKLELEQDIAFHLVEALKAAGYEQWSASDVDSARVLRDAVVSVKEEALIYQQETERRPSRMIAQLGGALDEVWEMSRHVRQTPEATLQLKTLANAVAILESAFDPDVDDSASATRYLATPKFSHHDFVLPEGAIDDRLTLSLERFRAQETLSPDQRKSLRTNRRLMYTLFNQRAPAKSGRDIV